MGDNMTDNNTHELKVWKSFYSDIASKMKRFEIRKNDRNFKPGDTLILLEWDPELEKYTGNRCDAGVDYILYHDDFPQGIQKDYCVMSISVTATRKVYK